MIWTAPTELDLAPELDLIAPGAVLAAVGADAAAPLLGADATLGAIFRAFGGAYLEQYGAAASDEQRRVLQLMALCRTPVLGMAHWECEQCGHVHELYNPCRDRHCGSCGQHAASQWYAAHQAELLPLPYQHVIFTAPHQLHVLLDVWQNRRVVYRLYLRAAHRAWQRVLADQFDVAAALAALIHSWNQLQLVHVHVHTVWPTVGWSLSDPNRLVEIDPAQVDKKALIEAFREALLGGVCRAAERGRLVMTGQAAFLESGAAFCDWIQDLKRRDWVLRPQPALDGGEAALGYLSRYIRGVAIGNRRILQFDPDRGTVTFEYRDNESGPHGEDVIRETTIAAVEFIRRYLEHVMPKGLGRGRFYGWWSGGKKGKELPRIRAALDLPQEEPDGAEQGKDADGQAPEPDEAPRRTCPACKEPALVRLWHDSAPRLPDLMRLVLWPQQRTGPVEHQTPLPPLGSWLPGGDEYLTSLYAQVGWSPASGFT